MNFERCNFLRVVVSYVKLALKLAKNYGATGKSSTNYSPGIFRLPTLIEVRWAASKTMTGEPRRENELIPINVS